MACSWHGQTLILVTAESAVSAFEAIIPALQAGGKISGPAATALTAYVNSATSTLQTVIQEIESNTSTLPKIAEVIQTLVTEYDQVGAALTPGISLWVNVANVAIQALLGAINAEIGQQAAATPAPAAIAPSGGISQTGHAESLEEPTAAPSDTGGTESFVGDLVGAVAGVAQLSQSSAMQQPTAKSGASSTIKVGFFEGRKLGGYEHRLANVQKNLAKATSGVK